MWADKIDIRVNSKKVVHYILATCSTDTHQSREPIRIKFVSVLSRKNPSFDYFQLYCLTLIFWNGKCDCDCNCNRNNWHRLGHRKFGRWARSCAF